ncbi:hypothetical protein [Demequina flava]|uniref:hypothetical protein n=1 Tax=Demequina flava TaxID=1095025 RepID=UPI0007833370|nr:hypothetical protein [Demequina flava]
MSISVSALAHVAALASAVPQLTVSLDTHGGTTVIVGDFAEASMCAHAFRHVVSQWPAQNAHDPCVEQIHFDGGHARGPLLAAGPVRWFVTDLSAQRAVSALRSVRPRAQGAAASVRFDSVLAVSVVRFESDVLDADALDELATSAYAACAVEHLVNEAATDAA